MSKLFKNLLKQQKLQKWLENEGFRQVESKTNKYIAMKHPDKEQTYFLGKNGAFRVSQKGIVSDSIGTAPNKGKFDAFCSEMENKEAKDVTPYKMKFVD